MRVFHLPKRSGGFRTIYAPNPEEAEQLRSLLPVLDRVQQTDAVHAFRRHHSPVTAAEPHTGMAVTVSLDLSDCFDSCTLALARTRGVPQGEPYRFRKWIYSITGFRETVGSFSDTAILATDLHIPACNLAIGYVYEHSHREMLRLDRWREGMTAAYRLAVAQPPKDFGPWTRRRTRYWTTPELDDEEQIEIPYHRADRRRSRRRPAHQ